MEKLYNNIQNNWNDKIIDEYFNYLKRIEIFKLSTNWEESALLETFLYNRVYSQIYLKKEPYHSYNYINDDDVKYLKEYYAKLPYIDKIIEIVNRKNPKNIKTNIKIDKKYIWFGEIQFKLDDRIKFLINLAKTNILKYNGEYSKKRSKLIAIKLVIRCMLRYSSLGITGHHCSLTNEVYYYMYKNLGLKGEGFCSPFNSKLIEYDDTKICTIFEDTDKYFKSLGPFNKSVILENDNINWSINPPFFKSAIKLCIKGMFNALDNSKKNILIIMTIPYTKIDVYKEEIFNKYMFGYINEKHIHIKKSLIGDIRKNIIDRENTNQVFICNGKVSKSFEDIYMLFYTNSDKNIKEDIMNLSALWSNGVTKDRKQSDYREPIKKLK